MYRGAIVFEERVRVPSNVFHLDGFREWAHSSQFPNSGCISFIGGEVEIDTSPEEIESHNKLKGGIFIALGVWIRQENLGDLLSDGALLVNESADLATEPDIAFCSWDALRSERVRYAEKIAGSERLFEVRGSPDLVVEVVSEHSVRKDTVLLRDRYFRAEVVEYWIIDARSLELKFELLRRGDREFESTEPDADGYRKSTVLDRSFRVDRERNPVGGAAYRILDR